MKSENQVRLLVYVPCWINFQQGLEQVEKLSAQQKTLESKGIDLDLEVVVSINAVDLIPADFTRKLDSLGARVRHFITNLSDVNINLGFLDAIQSSADLFWIVSPGDPVSETALARLSEMFGSSSNLDFVVADEERRGIRNITLQINKLNFLTLSEASFGMVTGVVYRVDTFRPYLHLGVQAAFTGWGQLAVLLGGARKKGGINGRILPSEYFYFRGDLKQLSYQQKLENLRTYAHSFFGFVILMSLLLPKPNQQMRTWVYKNWFRAGSYTNVYSQEKFGYVRLTDLRHLAKVAVAETDFFTRTIYALACRIDFAQLKKKLMRGDA
jgi:hypothetical protein